MDYPAWSELTRPVLVALANGGKNSRGCQESIAQHFGIPPDMALAAPAGSSRGHLINRISWAIVSLGQAGLINKVRPGHYEITEEGRAALSSRTADFDNAFLMTYPTYAAANSTKSSEPSEALPEKTEDLSPEDLFDLAASRADKALELELEDRLIALAPDAFERLVVNLLVAMGFGRGMPDAGRAIGRGGDGGIDGIINEDALGLDAVYIQAKRYAPENKVGRPAIQQFVGSLTGEGASKGVFVTTSDFSAEARAYAARVQQRIVLIDGRRLARLMIANEIGVRARRTYVLRSVDEDYFIDS